MCKNTLRIIQMFSFCFLWALKMPIRLLATWKLRCYHVRLILLDQQQQKKIKMPLLLSSGQLSVWWSFRWKIGVKTNKHRLICFLENWIKSRATDKFVYMRVFLFFCWIYHVNETQHQHVLRRSCTEAAQQQQQLLSWKHQQTTTYNRQFVENINISTALQFLF